MQSIVFEEKLGLQKKTCNIILPIQICLIHKPFFLSYHHTVITSLTQISQNTVQTVMFVIIRFRSSLTQIRGNQVWK